MVKKYLVTLGCVCFSQAFSFNKMSDLILHKRSKREMGSVQYTQISVPKDLTYAQLSDNLKHGEFYFGYIYDEDSHYGLSGLIPYNYLNINNEMTFNLLKRQKFNKEWWDNFIEAKLDVKINKFYISNKEKEYINVEIEKTNIIKQLNSFIQSNQVSFASPMGTISQQSIDINKISFKHEINVHCINDTVAISNSVGTHIDFKKALLAYMKKYENLGDRSVQNVLNLLKPINSQEDNNNLNENNKSNVSTSIVQIQKEAKAAYTEKEIELLRTSRILAIWSVDPKIYSNKSYVESEMNSHPNMLYKQLSSKLVNQVVMGFAVDKNNETFNWVIDLGQDIKVLFDKS